MRPRYFILDANRKPAPCHNLIEWSDWFETANRRVRLDETGGLRISTVFLGTDHNFSGNGPPILYETMIEKDGDWLNYTARYATEEKAIEGHEFAFLLARDFPEKLE